MHKQIHLLVCFIPLSSPSPRPAIFPNPSAQVEDIKSLGRCQGELERGGLDSVTKEYFSFCDSKAPYQDQVVSGSKQLSLCPFSYEQHKVQASKFPASSHRLVF